MNDIAQEIARKSKSSFYYAFSLLPPLKRDAMNTVYAFCRETDDIVDEGNEPEAVKFEKLRKWRMELERALKGHSDYTLLNKLGKTINQFNIPLDPFFDLLRGMEMDLSRKKIITFEDLSAYCYCVASSVGLMCIEIFGYKHKSAKDFAVNLGIALQLTNILRDIKKDAQRGRIYLPEEDLRIYNYSDSEIFESRYNPQFINLMKFEVNRAREYFQLASESLSLDDKSSMFAARAMQHIYSKMLDKIEKVQYNVYTKNIRVSNIEKAGISIGVWAKYSLVY